MSDLSVMTSACSIDHVGELYPASSFSSVRLVSSWMTAITERIAMDHVIAIPFGFSSKQHHYRS